MGHLIDGRPLGSRAMYGARTALSAIPRHFPAHPTPPGPPSVVAPLVPWRLCSRATYGVPETDPGPVFPYLDALPLPPHHPAHLVPRRQQGNVRRPHGAVGPLARHPQQPARHAHVPARGAWRVGGGGKGGKGPGCLEVTWGAVQRKRSAAMQRHGAPMRLFKAHKLVQRPR